MKIPEGLKYSKEHEWVRVEGNRAIIGITDYAQAQLGDVVFVELPEMGVNVCLGAGISVVESVKAVSDIYVPVSGKVADVNEALLDVPEALNQDPYGDGWIFAVEIADESELEQLMNAGEYEEFTEQGGE
jgi:glycine cleavage system H protein